MFVILEPADNQRLVDETGKLLQFDARQDADEYLWAIQEQFPDEYKNYEVCEWNERRGVRRRLTAGK